MGKTDAGKEVKESFFCPLCGAKKILPSNNNSEKQYTDCNPGCEIQFARHLTQNSIGLCLCQLFGDNPEVFFSEFN